MPDIECLLSNHNIYEPGSYPPFAFKNPII
jgi:hypothetical protein